MKSFKLITPLLLLLSSPFIAIADDVDEELPDTDDNVIEVKDYNHNPTGRPKAPSRQRISCNCTAGNLYVQFAIPEGNCELTIIDNETGESQIFCFDSSIGAFLNIGKITSFELYIETEKGNSYYGHK